MTMLLQIPKDPRWFTSSSCARKLRVRQSSLGPPGDRIAVNFAGRGKVGLSCGGTDAYVTQFSDAADIDVWRAYRNGVWTSSTTVLIYYASTAAVPLTFQGLIQGTAHVVSKVATCDVLPACPTTLLATVTINADGTFSIA